MAETFKIKKLLLIEEFKQLRSEIKQWEIEDQKYCYGLVEKKDMILYGQCLLVIKINKIKCQISIAYFEELRSDRLPYLYGNPRPVKQISFDKIRDFSLTQKKTKMVINFKASAQRPWILRFQSNASGLLWYTLIEQALKVRRKIYDEKDKLVLQHKKEGKNQREEQYLEDSQAKTQNTKNSETNVEQRQLEYEMSPYMRKFISQRQEDKISEKSKMFQKNKFSKIYDESLQKLQIIIQQEYFIVDEDIFQKQFSAAVSFKNKYDHQKQREKEQIMKRMEVQEEQLRNEIEKNHKISLKFKQANLKIIQLQKFLSRCFNENETLRYKFRRQAQQNQMLLKRLERCYSLQTEGQAKANQFENKLKKKQLQFSELSKRYEQIVGTIQEMEQKEEKRERLNSQQERKMRERSDQLERKEQQLKKERQEFQRQKLRFANSIVQPMQESQLGDMNVQNQN